MNNNNLLLKKGQLIKSSELYWNYTRKLLEVIMNTNENRIEDEDILFGVMETPNACKCISMYRHILDDNLKKIYDHRLGCLMPMELENTYETHHRLATIRTLFNAVQKITPYGGLVDKEIHIYYWKKITAMLSGCIVLEHECMDNNTQISKLQHGDEVIEHLGLMLEQYSLIILTNCALEHGMRYLYQVLDDTHTANFGYVLDKVDVIVQASTQYAIQQEITT